MKKLILLLLTILGTARCGGGPLQDYPSLLLRHPQLLRISPEPGAQLQEPFEFTLEFSQRLDIQKIHPYSVALLKGDLPPDLKTNNRELMDALREEELPQVPLTYRLQDDERRLHLKAEGPLPEGLYTLLITPALSSTEGVPFNQKPGESPQAYWASYGIGSQVHLLPETTQGTPPDFFMIHEVLYDGLQSESDGEAFIELYGTPDADIGGFSLRLINGSNGEVTDEIRVPEGTKVPDSGLWVVADLRTNSNAETFVPVYHFLDHFDPQNGPDAIHLLDEEGTVWDALCYGEGAVDQTPAGEPLCEGAPAPDAGPGESLSRVNGKDTNQNFTDFVVLANPTPGEL